MVVIWNDPKLTDHFSLAEYAVHQSADCFISRQALAHAEMLEEFRTWLDKPMKVNGWYRTKAYNAKVKGSENSSHLKGCATDIAMSITEATFIRYAKRWKKICASHGVVGEIGFYPSQGFVHFGSHITYSKTFYHWRTVNGVQKDMVYGGKI